MKTILMILVILVSAGIAHAAPEAICSSAAVLFCDNFEDRPANSTAWAAVNVGPKTPAWDMSDVNGIQVSTQAAFDGTKALAFKYPPCRWKDNQSDQWHCGVGYGQQNFSARGDLWVRMYVMHPTGYLQIGAEKMWSMQTSPSGHRAPWAYSGSPGGGPDLAGIKAGVLMYEHESTPYARYDQNVGSPFTFAKNQWHCVELHLVQGSNGRNDGWIDGVQKFNYSANWTEPWSVFFISGYGNTLAETQSSCQGKGFRWDGTYCNRDNPQTRYFDNIVVSTQRIGCLGSAPPQPQTVQLTTTVSGAGTVTGGGSYPVGATVTPVATASAGATFTGWSGDCTGMTCTVTMTANKAVTATFTGGTTPPPVTGCAITPTPAAITFAHPPGGPLPPPQSLRVVTSDGSPYKTFDTGFYDAAPCYTQPCPSGTMTTITPQPNTLALAAGTYTYPLDLTAGPNCPKVSVPVVLTIGAATVPPPSMGKLTVDATVTRCNYFLTAEPPDTTGGWVAQFLRDGANTVGNPISTPPYRRSVELYAPSHSFTVEFSKTGTIKRSPAAVTRVCP